jgi:hypothetical protein
MMIKTGNDKNLTLDEMIDCLRNPTSDKRSLAELDTVIDEIMDRNPKWVEHIMRIVEQGQRK